MLYETLRAAAGIALRWFYGDIVVQGRERIPARGPLLLVANHPNALVDALLVGITLDRRVLLTAKATLFEHPLLAPLLGGIGVVPLRRAKDEKARAPGDAKVRRNEDSFRLVVDALRKERVVLVFPEGISHDATTLAPLRTGAARMALQAHEEGVGGLQILPIGLVFEEKERARSTVLVRVADPLDLDAWIAMRSSADSVALTHEIDARLRRVTLNFATSERAARAVRLAHALAAASTDVSPIGNEQAFPASADIATRIEAATEALEHSPQPLAERADAFVARVDALSTSLASRVVALEDARIAMGTREGARFMIREGALAAIAFPIAALGRILHWLPIRLTRTLVVRSLAGDASRDQPAMRTIVLGTAAVIAWYILQAALVAHWFGVVMGLLWLVAIFAAAQVDLRFSDRLVRARRRARSYLALRADPAFRERTLGEMSALLGEAVNLERELAAASGD